MQVTFNPHPKALSFLTYFYTGPSKEKDKEKKDDILVYDEMTKQCELF